MLVSKIQRWLLLPRPWVESFVSESAFLECQGGSFKATQIKYMLEWMFLIQCQKSSIGKYRFAFMGKSCIVWFFLIHATLLCSKLKQLSFAGMLLRVCANVRWVNGKFCKVACGTQWSLHMWADMLMWNWLIRNLLSSAFPFRKVRTSFPETNLFPPVTQIEQHMYLPFPLKY